LGGEIEDVRSGERREKLKNLMPGPGFRFCLSLSGTHKGVPLQFPWIPDLPSRMTKGEERAGQALYTGKSFLMTSWNMKLVDQERGGMIR
jgi:hypothetical protein